jgi:GMP synthase-like glutamine amidotransferase
MKKFVTTLFVLACVITYVYSAVDIHTGQTFSVNVDLSKPLAIVWPFEVSIVGDMGEKGLRIGPKIGRGWRGEAGGEATYRFYVPKDGTYYIWACCLWFDECTNAVFAKIDNLDKAIIGNDNIYTQWHWVRGFDVHLEKGTHTLVLSNHSDHISLQKVLFTNSASIVPEDSSLVFSDIFYDGFDGCDQGNFNNWEVVCGEWTVQNPTRAVCLEENALIGKSEGSSFIIYKGDDWSGYSLNLRIRSLVPESTDGSVGICFGVKDSSQYHQLKLRRAERPNVGGMQISRKTTEGTEVLADFEVPWEAGQWHQMQIALNPNNIAVEVDDAKPIETSVNRRITGGIGLQLEGKVTAHFDDIHVRQITEVDK